MSKRSLSLIFVVLMLCTGFACLTLRSYLIALDNTCKSQAYAFLDIPARPLTVSSNSPANGYNTGTVFSESIASVIDSAQLSGGASSSAQYKFEQQELPIENGDTEAAYKTSAKSDSFCWMYEAGSTLASSNTEGQYTPGTLNPFINGVSQEGQERWLYQWPVLFAGLITSNPGDFSHSVAKGYAVYLTAKCERNANGSYTTRYYGFYYLGNEDEDYDSDIPPVALGQRLYTIPPEASSLDDDYVSAITIGHNNCIGSASASILTKTQKIGGEAGGGGGGGCPIVP